MGGIGVIHNPFARKNLIHPAMGDELKEILGNCGTLYETKNNRDIELAAVDFMASGYDLLAINGGDGSLHLVINAFRNVFKETALPDIVILRGGTMNTVANSLKLKGQPADILKRTLDKYNNNREFDYIHQQVLKVGDKYGFMSGAGAITTFLDIYYAGTHTGVVESLKMIFKMIMSTVFRTDYVKNIFSPVPMKVIIDGKNPGQESYLAVLGCAVRELGIGFAVAHSAYDKKGCFHFTATSMNPVSLILRMWSLWAGKEICHPDMYHHGIAADVIIEPVGTLRWMLDGEMYETEEPLQISVADEIRILRV